MKHFLCEHCNKSFENYSSFRKHLSMSHKISSVDTYIKYKCEDIRPTCECGCGSHTKFLGENAGFRRFISGHNSMTSNNNYHKNPETKIKSAKTQSENWKKGKYKGWWEEDTKEVRDKIEGIKEKIRNDKERAKKISKSLKGRKKTQEHKDKLSVSAKKRYSENPQLLEDARKRRIEWLKRKNKVPSKLEVKFKRILNLLGLEEKKDYIFQYELGKRLFDFYLKKWEVLIEVDGDFYHVNPLLYEIEYDCQKITKKNDDFKNEIVKNHNIKLVRFWEKDINERPEWVISEIKKLL